MTRLALCLLLLANLAGCQPDCWSSDPDECRAEREQARANAEREKMSRGYSVESLTSSIDVIHDDKRSVTCWRYAAGNAGGLSCIADWMLRNPETAGNERQLSPHEQEDNGPTPAGAERRWDEERCSL